MICAQSSIWGSKILLRRKVFTQKIRLSLAADLQKITPTLSPNRMKHLSAVTKIIHSLRWWCRVPTRLLHAVWRVPPSAPPRKNLPVHFIMRQSSPTRPNIWTSSARNATCHIVRLSCLTEVILSSVTANCAVTLEIWPVSISTRKPVPTKTTNRLSVNLSAKVTRLSELKFLWMWSCNNLSKMLKLLPPSLTHKLFTFPTESHLLIGWMI